MKRTHSMNRRALRRLLAASLLTAAALIVIFSFAQMNDIHARAREALREFSFSTTSGAGRKVPGIEIIDAAYRDETMLTPTELMLLAAYDAKKDVLPDGEIARWAESGNDIFYFTMPQSDLYGSGYSGKLLVYADVSFPSEVVRRTTGLLAVLFLAFGALLILMERHTAEVLDRKDQSLKDFFANASHELKTPVMAISGYAESLRKGVVDQDKACDVIERETGRMSELIGGILDLSKLDSGARQPNCLNCDAREIVYDALNAIALETEERGIELTVHMPQPLPVCGDEDMLFSVFSNLLTNAARYAEKEIAVTGDIARDVLRVTVSNDGPPISPEDAAHVFDRFYKGSRGQTGVGMALAKEYTELHHGKIQADAESGKTRFIVLLPTER